MASSNLKVQQITNFNSGEFSPEMAGRVDLESFASSARNITNFLPTVSGGLKKFYGTAHVHELEKPFEFKIVPFINRHEPAAFVLHDSNVGFITKNKYRELDINIPNDIDYARLRWKQVNDRVIFVHPERQPFSIDFYGIDVETQEYQFVSSQVVFDEIPYFPIGFKGQYSGDLEAAKIANDTYTLTIPAGGVKAFIGFPTPLDTSASYMRINYSSETEEISSGSDISLRRATVRIFKVVQDGQPVELVSGTASTITSTSVDYTEPTMAATTYMPTISNSISSSSTGGITGGGSSTRPPTGGTSISTPSVVSKFQEQLLRENVLNAVKVQFPDAYLDENYIVLNDNSGEKFIVGDKLYMQIETYDCTVDGEITATGEVINGFESQAALNIFSDVTHLVGSKIKIYTNTDSLIYPWYAEETVSEGDIRYSNGSFYRANTSGSCGTAQPIHNKGTASDGKVSWTYLHSGSTSATITDVSDDKQQLTIQLPRNASLPILSKDETMFNNFAWSVWGYNGVHPSDIYFIQNRLGIVCNTDSFGAWNAMSVSDNYLDFSTEQYGQQLDTSAIVHVITNNPDNKINWVLSYNTLYMGSDTTEFSLTASNKVFTPTTLVCNPVSSLGGASIVPLKYKELNLFVGSKKDELYTIGYDYTIEDYVPKSIGYITNHLLEQGITRLEPINNKDQSVYILHDTGSLSVLNYVGEQAVLAYSEINAGAEIKDICSTSSKSDRWTYIAVERRPGMYSIEYIADEHPTYMWNTYDYLGEEVTSFDIEYFSDQTVYIIVDDQFIEVKLDENGHYDFDEPTDNYSVGIKMVSELHTQPAFGRKAEGVAQQSVKVSMRLLTSGAFEYGDSTNFEHYVKFENWGTDQELGKPLKLYTGDVMLDLATGYTMMFANEGKGPYPNTTGVGINIKSFTPQPFNLLSVTEVYV